MHVWIGPIKRKEIEHNLLFWLNKDMTKDPWSQHSIYELIEYINLFIYIYVYQ